MFGDTIGIDLGSSFVRIYMKGQGVLLCESTVAAVEGGNVISAGNTAAEICGRAPKNIKAVHPVQNAVISDADTAEKIIRYFIKKACGNRLFKPSGIISVPGEISAVCENALISAAEGAGMKNVELCDVPIAAAIGAGVNIMKPRGTFICDVGSGCSDIAVISAGGIVISSLTKTAGDSFDKVIADYIKNEKHIEIGKKTAESVKAALSRSEKINVRGRCLYEGLPKKAETDAEELIPVIRAKAMEIVFEIIEVLKKTPPGLLNDISDDGIILCGGSANLALLPEMIEEYTGIKCIVPERNGECVINGIGKMIENGAEEIEKAN